MPVTVREILGSLEQLAPSALAESWDNVGLLVGDARQQAQTVLVALDTTPEVLEQATAQHVELLVTHHPLIFSGLKRLLEDGGISSSLRRLVRENCSLIALHTNLDSAPGGLNTYVAAQLGIRQSRPLIPTAARALLKLVVYVPESHVDVVRTAICAAGAGQIGHYSECTFDTLGTGTFRPEAGTHPYIGETGVLERVPEVRLETVVPKHALSAVLQAMHASHPYEEVAYDLIILEIPWPEAGLGRIGQLPAPVTAAAFTERIKTVLQAETLEFAGDPQRPVHTVALCTGAGGDFLGAALRQGADLYLTGEIKHHQALEARQSGMAIVVAGHFATERPAVPLLADYLADRHPELRIVRAEECDPLSLR